jgi:hypothetical protein
MVVTMDGHRVYNSCGCRCNVTLCVQGLLIGYEIQSETECQSVSLGGMSMSTLGPMCPYINIGFRSNNNIDADAPSVVEGADMEDTGARQQPKPIISTVL